jgi:hypothetical protein
MARWFRTASVEQAAITHGMRNLDAELADMIVEAEEVQRHVAKRIAERKRNMAERPHRSDPVQEAEDARLRDLLKATGDLCWELHGARNAIKKAGVTPWKSVNVPTVAAPAESSPATATVAARF